MMNSSYFNTTNQVNPYLQELVDNCARQEVIVYELFKKYKKLTASDIYQLYPNNNVPLTSVRRACTTLLNSGKVNKLEETKIGLYGKPEKFYRIIGIDNQQYSMF